MDKLAKLLEVVDKKDKARLTILNNAVVRNMKAYQSDPTAARKKDWDAAEEGLQKEIDRLWAEHFGGQAAVPDDRFLPNLIEAMHWLQNLGYKIKKTKIYDDKKKGKIYVWPDGRVYKADAELYARNYLVKEKSPDLEEIENKTLEELQQEKLRTEAERNRIRAERERFLLDKERGQYIHVDQVEYELSWRARIFRYSLENFIHEHAPRIAAMFGGEDKAAAKLIEAAGGQQDNIPRVVAWAESRIPDLIDLYLLQVEEFLGVFATDSWFTEDMQEFFGADNGHESSD